MFSATRTLLQQQRQPMIKFLGKRSTPPSKLSQTTTQTHDEPTSNTSLTPRPSSSRLSSPQSRHTSPEPPPFDPPQLIHIPPSTYHFHPEPTPSNQPSRFSPFHSQEFKTDEPTQEIDHTPHTHPASPSDSLPRSFSESFAQYRDRVQTHGPLKSGSSQSSSFSSSSASTPSEGKAMQEGRSQSPGGGVHSRSGASYGPVEAGQGEFFDRSELPRRFGRTSWSEAEIEAIDSGGASAFGW